jgi:hypothetical protein
MNKTQVMKLLKYKNIEVIGSSRDAHLKYPSDIDLQDIAQTNDTYDDIYKFFLNVFEKINKSNNAYVVDFKAGIHKGKPIKWKYEDIKNGYKMKNDLKITFQYALTHDNSMIKIDLIVIQPDKSLMEYSNNYYLTFRKYRFSNFEMDTRLIINRLEYDYRMLMKDEKYYKALKRLYSIFKIKKDKKKTKLLVELFNSPLGELYKQKSSLETIKLVFTNQLKISDDIIRYNLDEISKHLPLKYHTLLNKVRKSKYNKSIIDKLDKLINTINDDINIDTDEWMKTNKI